MCSFYIELCVLSGHVHILWLWEVGPAEKGGLHVWVQVLRGPRLELSAPRPKPPARPAPPAPPADTGGRSGAPRTEAPAKAPRNREIPPSFRYWVLNDARDRFVRSLWWLTNRHHEREWPKWKWNTSESENQKWKKKLTSAQRFPPVDVEDSVRGSRPSHRTFCMIVSLFWQFVLLL